MISIAKYPIGFKLVPDQSLEIQQREVEEMKSKRAPFILDVYPRSNLIRTIGRKIELVTKAKA